MSVTYNLVSGQYPLPIAPAAPVLGGGTTGPWSSGMLDPGVSYKMNQWAYANVTLASQYGGGGYGVLGDGLQVSSVSGLNIAVSPGIAIVDNFIEFITSGVPSGPQILLNTTCTLFDNALNFVWVTSSGPGSGGIAVNTTVLTPPSNARFLLACVTCASGVVTNIDYSGRSWVAGSSVYRQTGDTGPPTDTPPSNWNGQTITQFGTYNWNGSQHLGLPAPIQATYNFTANLPATLTQPYYAAQVLTITDTSSFLSGAQSVYYPAVPTGIFAVVNKTAQSLNIMVATGTGFTVAAGMSATAFVDGANVKQLSTPIAATVSLDASAAATPGSTMSLTWSHTNAGNYIAVAVVQNIYPHTIPTATYNGVSLTLLGSAENDGSHTIQWLGLANPPIGTYNVVINDGVLIAKSAYSVSFINAGTTPTLFLAAATSAAPNVNVTTSAGDIALDVVVAGAALTSGTTQLQATNISGMYSAVSYKIATGGTTNQNYSLGSSGNWAMEALDIPSP